jgi:hypothetical protein
MKRVVLGNCKKCDAQLTYAHVGNVVQTPSGRRYFYRCPTCKIKDDIFWSTKELYVRRREVAKDKNKKLSQKIGNTVYGFKMDLDAFTVDEIIGLWEYEERNSPERIPQETGKRVWLR